MLTIEQQVKSLFGQAGLENSRKIEEKMSDLGVICCRLRHHIRRAFRKTCCFQRCCSIILNLLEAV
jgi:hypothetical protein